MDVLIVRFGIMKNGKILVRDVKEIVKIIGENKKIQKINLNYDSFLVLKIYIKKENYS